MVDAQERIFCDKIVSHTDVCGHGMFRVFIVTEMRRDEGLDEYLKIVCPKCSASTEFKIVEEYEEVEVDIEEGYEEVYKEFMVEAREDRDAR